MAYTNQAILSMAARRTGITLTIDEARGSEIASKINQLVKRGHLFVDENNSPLTYFITEEGEIALTKYQIENAKRRGLASGYYEAELNSLLNGDK